MKKAATLAAAVLLAGCGSHLSSYDLKASTGMTNEQDGNRSTTSGISASFHFDVERQAR